ncbi:MAG TPA: hypothetical protein PKE64_26790, partial [Anaerolineae bacterium]|nr:hypothetical protein [Anaerolineae bacterium]
RGGQHVATVRAAPDTEVEVATLDKATFERLLAESAPTKAQLSRMADERLEENRTSRHVVNER